MFEMLNMERKLSQTEKSVLSAVYRYQQENNNWYPVVRDIQAWVKNSTSTIARNLNNLVDRGFVESREGKVAYRITEKGLAYLKGQGIIAVRNGMPRQELKEYKMS